MSYQLQNYKGIHPGKVLERILVKKEISQRPFAISIGEHPQTLNAILKGRRGLNVELALKIELALGLEEGSLAILQTYYNIAEHQKKILPTPNLLCFRKSLFWDTDISKINWIKQYQTIIKRVYERGNDTEKNALETFYGLAKIKKVLESENSIPYTLYKNKQTI